MQIYSRPTCPYCQKAKILLQKHSIEYEEINILKSRDKEREMLERSEGRRTVPQIFIRDVPIGGYSELRELEKSGQLKNLVLGH